MSEEELYYMLQILMRFISYAREQGIAYTCEQETAFIQAEAFLDNH